METLSSVIFLVTLTIPGLTLLHVLEDNLFLCSKYTSSRYGGFSTAAWGDPASISSACSVIPPVHASPKSSSHPPLPPAIFTLRSVLWPRDETCHDARAQLLPGFPEDPGSSFLKKIKPFIRAHKQAQVHRHCVTSSPASRQSKAAATCNITFNRPDKLEQDVSLLSDISPIFFFFFAVVCSFPAVPFVFVGCADIVIFLFLKNKHFPHGKGENML